MSDMYPYKSVPGSNRTEGTSHEALAIPGNFQSRPDFPSQKSDINLYTGATQCRDIRQVVLSFSKNIRSSTPVFKCYPYTTYHIFGMGYTTQRSSPG